LDVSLVTSPWTQVGGEIGVTNPQMEKMKNVFRGVAVLIIPISARFPSVSEIT